MIRVIFLTIVFLFFELLCVNKFLGNLALNHKLWYLNIGNDSQRRVFKIIYDIGHSKNKNLFIFGGSASREYFENDMNMTKSLNIKFHNCAVSSEAPFDSLKLQSLIHYNTIAYGLHIKSLYDHSFDEEQIIKGYYFGGAYYKYPIIYKNKNINIDNKKIPKINQISPILNTYIYLFKEYAKRLFGNKILNYKEPKQYHYNPPQLPEEKLNNKLNKYFKLSRKNMKKNLSLNFFLVEQMIIQAGKQHNKFILYELPFSPIIKRRFKPYFSEYYKKLNILLKKYPNIIFISNKTLPAAKQTLFYDTIHLLPRGRKYYYKATMENFKKAINVK